MPEDEIYYVELTTPELFVKGGSSQNRFKKIAGLWEKLPAEEPSDTVSFTGLKDRIERLAAGTIIHIDLE